MKKLLKTTGIMMLGAAVLFTGCKKDKDNGIYAHRWPSFADLEMAYREIEQLMLAPRKAEV